MWDIDEFFAVALMWLGLTTLVVVYAARIALLLHRQRQAEFTYRLHLAAVRRAALRDVESETGTR